MLAAVATPFSDAANALESLTDTAPYIAPPNGADVHRTSPPSREKAVRRPSKSPAMSVAPKTAGLAAVPAPTLRSHAISPEAASSA